MQKQPICVAKLLDKQPRVMYVSRMSTPNPEGEVRVTTPPGENLQAWAQAHGYRYRGPGLPLERIVPPNEPDMQWGTPKQRRKYYKKVTR